MALPPPPKLLSKVFALSRTLLGVRGGDSSSLSTLLPSSSFRVSCDGWERSVGFGAVRGTGVGLVLLTGGGGAWLGLSLLGCWVGLPLLGGAATELCILGFGGRSGLSVFSRVNLDIFNCLSLCFSHAGLSDSG